MAGLVLEGGSFRGIFSAGVMDALLDYDITFDYIIGVSAGISNGMSYISKQKGRNMEIMRQYRNDKRYMSKANLLKHKSLYGLDFMFDEIPNKLIPFDWDTYRVFRGTIKVGVTDVDTGTIVYKDGKELDEKCTMLRATCAIPVVFPVVTIDGRHYYDGGISDSIPIKQSILDGNEKNLVVLTQPKGFVKEQSKVALASANLFHKQYPELSETILNRPKMYNDTLEYIEKLKHEQPQNIVILQPEYKLSSSESDVSVLEKTYLHGYMLAVQNIDAIKKLFD